METLSIEIDDEMAGRLARVAPMSSRRRAEFVRAAILTALQEAEERPTVETNVRLSNSHAVEPGEERGADSAKQDVLKFLVRFAHEITLPLSAAEQHVGFVEAVVRGDRRVRDPQEHINYIRENLAYLTYLVRDIQLQAGHWGLRENYEFRRRIDMRPVIERVKKLLLQRARLNRYLEIRTQTASLPELFVDKIRMEQVFFNLIDNAIKYSARGAHDIVIRYERRDVEIEGYPGLTQWHCINVMNWGIGVAEGEDEKIFKDYARGSNAHYAPSGTGLGLPVSRRIIECHGGALRLTGRQWPTVFTVFLPTYLETKGPSVEDTPDR